MFGYLASRWGETGFRRASRNDKGDIFMSSRAGPRHGNCLVVGALGFGACSVIVPISRDIAYYGGFCISDFDIRGSPRFLNAIRGVPYRNRDGFPLYAGPRLFRGCLDVVFGVSRWLFWGCKGKSTPINHAQKYPLTLGCLITFLIFAAKRIGRELAEIISLISYLINQAGMRVGVACRRVFSGAGLVQPPTL